MRAARRTSKFLAGTLLMLAALALAACGSAAAPSSPAASPAAATAAVTPSPTPTGTPTPSPTPTATSAPTSSPTEPAVDASVTIKLAKGWQEVELTETALKAQIKALQASNPQMVAMMEQWLATGAFKNMKYYALGYSGATVIGNINVNAIPLGGVPLDAIQPAIEGEFKQLGATGIKFRQATVAGVTSLIVDYKISIKTASGSLTMTGRAYLVPHGEVAYDATVTCYGKSTSTCLAAGDRMADSMRIVP